MMKRFVSVSLAGLILMSCVACGKTQEKNLDEIYWPSSEIVKRIPTPKSLTGEVQWESSEDYCVDLTDVTQAEYEDYVKACMDNGFTVDYYKDSSSFWAYDKDGYDLEVDYDEEEQIMSISIDSPDEEDEDADDSETTVTTTTKKQTTTTTKKQADDIDPDFQKAMDSYEKFMTEYVDFMKKYSANPTDLGLLTNYATYMSKYADFVEDFENWENEDLNDAELAYYIDVQARVSKKLLEVAQ